MGKSFYILKSGKIKQKEKTIFIEYYEDDVKKKRSIPVENVDQIFFLNEISLNSKFLELASKNSIILHFFNYYGFYIGSFYPREKNISGWVIIKQVEHYIDKHKRINLARKFVKASLHNIRRVLEKRGYEEIREKIKAYEEKINNVDNIENLMSMEAHARKLYYSVWEDITGWDFHSREIRPPSNEINALISFGNSLVYSIIVKELYLTPLSPAISYLHEPSEKRFSLALDIAEVFKPIFVDKLIFNLINHKKINKQKHFLEESGGTFLNDEGRKVFIDYFEKMLNTTIVHRKLKRKVKYKELIRLEIYKILKHLLEETEYKPLKVWW